MKKKALKKWTVLILYINLLIGLGVEKPVDLDQSVTQISSDDYRVWTAPSTLNIQRDAPPLMAKKVELEMAGNEAQSGQVFVTAIQEKTTISKAKISNLKAGKNVINARDVDIFVQHYIKTTKRSNKVYEPGWYPDALIPLSQYMNVHKNITVEKGQNQALLYTVKTTKNTPPGQYKGTISLTTNGTIEQIPITVKVRDFALTEQNHVQTAFVIWDWMLPYGYPGLVENSTEYWKLLQAYYEFFLNYHVTPAHLPIPSTNYTQYVKDAKKYVEDPRVSAYSLPYKIGDFENGRAKQLVDDLKAAKLLDKAYYYLGDEIDEPEPDKYPLVKLRSKQIKQIDPNLRHVVTTSFHSDLNDYVNNFAPLIQEFEQSSYEKTIQQQLNKGNEVWWYSCVIPANPYPTYHLDDDIISARLMPWMQKAYNVTGNLYWSVNVYAKWNGSAYAQRDIWNDPMAFEGANGDGVLVYPGHKYGLKNPIPTLRLVAIRDGNQDYEYLWLLEDRLNKAAKKLNTTIDVQKVMAPYYARLFKDVKTFTKNIEDVQSVRSDIATLIEKIDKDPKVISTLQ